MEPNYFAFRFGDWLDTPKIRARTCREGNDPCPMAGFLCRSHEFPLRPKATMEPLLPPEARRELVTLHQLETSRHSETDRCCFYKYTLHPERQVSILASLHLEKVARYLRYWKMTLVFLLLFLMNQFHNIKHSCYLLGSFNPYDRTVTRCQVEKVGEKSEKNVQMCLDCWNAGGGEPN